MEVMLSNRTQSGRTLQSEAIQALRLAEGSGHPPALLAYHPVANVNPYQALVYRRFAEAGIGVVPVYKSDEAMSLTTLARLGVPVIFHLHWTNWMIKGAQTPKDAQARVDRTAEWLTGLREGGVKIVWTRHNLLPHDAVFVEAELRLQQWIADNADVVHLMHDSADPVNGVIRVPTETALVVPHPNYVGAYADSYTRAQARGLLNLDPDEIVYVMVGALKPYKGLGKLLPAFHALGNEPPRRLVVAGNPDLTPAAQAFVGECLRDAKVLIDARTVPGDEVQIYLRAADIAVAPYERTLNSGFALLALSFGLPVVAPASGAMGEILDERCAQTYDPDAADGLALALAKADRLLGPEASAAARAVADKFDPDALSRTFAAELRRRLVGSTASTDGTETKVATA